MKFEIEIKTDRAIASMRRTQRNLRRMNKALDQVGMYMERETKLNFAKESTPAGAPWAGLAASTLRQKRSAAILRETSDLVNSIAAEPASETEVRVNGGGTEYGIYHQMGTSKMPQREYIGIESRHEPRIRKIIERYVSEVLG